MNPKFNKGNMVYYRNNPWLITQLYQYVNQQFYVIEDSNRIMVKVYEAELLSKEDWESSHKASQAFIGRMAFERGLSGKVDQYNGCSCGAHAVKDARHSTWCDIKN
jgi:hypothetical protein